MDTAKDISTLDIPDVVKRLESSENGLTEHEAHKRQISFGRNILTERKKRSILFEFLNNFLNPLILTLIVITVVSFLLGNTIDGVIILVMIAMSVTLNFFQEYKATKAAEALKAKVAHLASVVRNGIVVELPATKLVPGDVIELNAGDLIPADARLIETKDFFVDQSALSGESFPVEKTASPLTKKARDLSEMVNLVFSATGVHTGWARAMVITTGMNTEYGKIAGSIKELVGEDEFSVGIRQFSNMTVKLIFALVVFIFGFKAIVYHDVWNSLQFAVAVAVGLTPEFLPMILSVTMGKGSMRMARKGVIVKKLTAIPTIGSMDVLCTDKTGTLTQNKIALVKFVDIFGEISEPTLFHAYLNSHFQGGITNPMDDAVMAYGHLNAAGFQKIDEIPFDFERRRLTVVTKASDGTCLMVTKGAPEAMLPVMETYSYQRKIHTFTQSFRERYQLLYEKLSKSGFRVLAVATKPVEGHGHLQKTDESAMVFSGFIAFLDPAKKGVRQALDELELLGVELKVITGDNELVALKICKDVDIVIKGILLGNQMDELSDQQLNQVAQKTTVFARFDPKQKNRVIQALRRGGSVVGYLGDGINDAPSLTTADVGISVANAVEVAREAADLVLTHKSLAELVEGVKEGRKTFGNTMKYIMMGLSSNFGNMFSMIGAVIFIPFLPMLPIQILLNNFIYDFTQIMIPTDSVDEEYISQPKRLKIADIRRFMFLFGPISSIFDFLTFGILYMFYSSSPAQFQTGWFIESLATQTLVIHIIRTRLTPFVQSSASSPLTITTLAGVIFGWILPFTVLGGIFGFQPPSLSVLLLLAFVVVIYLITVEVAKRWFYRKLAPNPVVC